METRESRDFDDIPGTYVFDGQRSRLGYHLNMFCKSLDKPENREKFRADPEGYLQQYLMSDAQREAVLERDYLKMLHLGGNIYYTWKIASFDRVSMQAAGAAQSGDDMTEEDFRQMMMAGGRPIDGNRYAAEWNAGEDQ